MYDSRFYIYFHGVSCTVKEFQHLNMSYR